MAVDVSVKDIAIIGGVAALGIGAYSLLKKKNEVTVTPTQDWDKLNGFVEELKSGNQELIKSFAQILGTTQKGGEDDVKTPSPTTPLPDSSGGSSGGSGGGSSGGVDMDTLENLNDALDMLGLSGQIPKSKLLIHQSVDQDKESLAESGIGNFLISTPGISTITDGTLKLGHALHGTGEYLYNKLTGRDDSGNKL